MNYLLLYLTPFALYYTILSYRLPLSTMILDSQKPQKLDHMMATAVTYGR